MYKVMFGDDEFTDYVFKTEEDANVFISMVDAYGLKIVPAKIFSHKFWYTLTPYVAWFDGADTFIRIKVANPFWVDGMMEQKLIINAVKVASVDKIYTMVAFWDSAKDIEKATIIANSLFEGWKAGKG